MASNHGNTIISFKGVSFGYQPNKFLLEEADFSVRENAKVTIMGQNGAGKSTIFKMITGELRPTEGRISITDHATVAIARQVIPREELALTVREFFASVFKEKIYDLDRRIADALEVVNLSAPLDKLMGAFSGGQQARLLLAQALVQDADVLLLDEPTNNLDKAGIDHLTVFLMGYEKTVLVISHDADFLNTFTDGVLYLDSFTHKVEQYVGDYYDVVERINAQIERERAQNAQLKKSIIDRKEKVNFFSHKGGKMRKLASKLKEEAEEMEENMVDIRQEDRTLPPFTIPAQDDFVGAVADIREVTVVKDHEPQRKKVNISLRKGQRLAIKGPNGMGKSTLLRALALGEAPGATFSKDVRVGYYRQDFSGLNMDGTAFEALQEVNAKSVAQDIFAAAGRFLLPAELLKNKVGTLSEGQKGLLCYARFVLQQPGLLILDEPTNHINFRHLPVIAKAIDDFAGAIIIVSHVPEFMREIRIDETLDLSRL